MHYYQHHIGDFIKHTARLTDSQAMAYLRLIWLYYDKDGHVKFDIEQLSFHIGSDEKTTKMIIQTFFKVENGFLRHDRCDKELKGYLNKSLGGKLGANKRWNNNKNDSIPIAIPMPPQCDPNANQEPITNNHKPIKKHIGSRLPKDWVAPQEFIDFCNQERPDLNANYIVEQFKDYWVSVPGNKGVKLDWFATWRNWVRNQKAQPTTQTKFKNKSDVVTDAQFEQWLNGGEQNARLR